MYILIHVCECACMCTCEHVCETNQSTTEQYSLTMNYFSIHCPYELGLSGKFYQLYVANARIQSKTQQLYNFLFK